MLKLRKLTEAERQAYKQDLAQKLKGKITEAQAYAFADAMEDELDKHSASIVTIIRKVVHELKYEDKAIMAAIAKGEFDEYIANRIPMLTHGQENANE